MNLFYDYLRRNGLYPSDGKDSIVVLICYCKDCGRTIRYEDWNKIIKNENISPQEGLVNCMQCGKLNTVLDLYLRWIINYYGGHSQWMHEANIVASQYNDRMYYQKEVQDYINENSSTTVNISTGI